MEPAPPPNLPEDIVTEILVRIPALQLLKIRRVCKRWNDLISMDYFHNTHLNRSKEPNSPSPMLFVQTFGQKMLIFDKSELREVPNFKIDDDNFKVVDDDNKVVDDEDDSLRFNNITRIICSYDGLIVIERLQLNYFDYLIYNPVTAETMIINNSETGSQYFVYALFFNIWINEYCVILVKEGSQFEILNLGSPRPYRCKPLKAPKSMKHKGIFYSNKFDDPVVINNANIYWQLRFTSCEEFILAFNIKAEEFSFFPHPHPYSLNGCLELNDLKLRHRSMHIFDIHGNLSFIQIAITNSVTVIFNIWRRSTVVAAQAQAHDQQSPNWIKIHSVTINALKFKKFCIWPNSVFKVLVIQNGEILFVNRPGNFVYAYNFQLGTLRMIRRIDVINNSFLLYIPSFASLKNFESKICI